MTAVPARLPVPSRATLVVVPCFNEAARLDAAAFDAFVPAHPAVGFVFVDDGSTDATRVVLDALAVRHPDAVTVHTLSRNSGKAEAVRQGLLLALDARATAVGYWDADLATPLAAIDEFIAALEADAALVGVLGSRISRLGARVVRSPLRHYAGRAFATLASITLGMAVYDTQCGAKLFRKGPELAAALATPFASRWIFDVELLARLERTLAPADLESRLLELPLREWRDVAGSKVTLAHGAAAFVELWRISRMPR